MDMQIKQAIIEVLSNFTSEQLEDELDRRENEMVTVGCDALYAEYSCPHCGYLQAEDVDRFDEDGFFNACCEICDEKFIVDLEDMA